MRRNLQNNLTVFVNTISDLALAMYSKKVGILISLGKKESYVKFNIKGKTHFEFIPNNIMHEFIEKKVEQISQQSV